MKLSKKELIGVLYIIDVFYFIVFSVFLTFFNVYKIRNANDIILLKSCKSIYNLHTVIELCQYFQGNVEHLNL